MKNIADYFSSPSKTNSYNNSTTPLKAPSPLLSPKKSQRQNEEIKNRKVKKEISSCTKKSKKSLTRSSPNVENDEKPSKGKTKEKTEKKSKLQLKLKTPSNSSDSGVSSSKSPNQNQISRTLNCVENLESTTEIFSKSFAKNEDSQSSNSTSFKKVNAFQFLMDSRNNVIGQNADGKEVHDQSPSQKEEKERVDKCKNFLKDWAEKKGGAKRKREEIEIEKCINKKLDKRAKRLKNMLQSGVNTSDTEYDNFCKKKNKRSVRISTSSSESINKSVKDDRVNYKNNIDPKIIDDDNAQDCILIEDIEPKTTKIKTKKENKFKKDIDFQGLIPENSNKAKENLKSLKKSDKSIKKRSRLSSLDNFCKPLSDSSQESQDLTPKRLKKWHLKIKLNKSANNEDEDVVPRPKRKVMDRVSKEVDVEILDESSQESVKIINEKAQEIDDNEPQNITINSSDSEDEKPLLDLLRKTAKIAPIFGKAKKRLDEKTMQARRDFLLSGVPDKLKKAVVMQKSFEERQYNVFPSVSHIQQKCDHDFWELPNVYLNFKASDDFVLETANLIFKNLSQKEFDSKPIDSKKEVQKVKNMKTTLNQIKQDNPDYPVFKAFRYIYERSGKAKMIEEAKCAKKRKNRSSGKSAECQEKKEDAVCNKEHQMWTEKYKARCSEEILGNHTGVTKLKKWLVTWMNYSEEINSRRREKTGYDSSSEFDTTDCDSQDSVRLPGNTVIVGGPNGSGKTSAIYAIANEFGFNVLEVNATSRRTGKKLQQELQEATQSHQVRKKEIKAIFNIKKGEPKTAKKPEEKLDPNAEKEKKKMCILLIEDVDIIFEQDEGFLGSLTQLILTSKRPFILTTSDTGPNHIQKLLSQHEYISFAPLSLSTLSVWLQLVCLVEGLLVDQSDLGNLLEYNKGDIRKTLLEVQFWTQSGGQFNSGQVLPILTRDYSKSWEKQPIPDEELNMSLKDDCNGKTENFVHKNILGSFVVFKGGTVPLDINLGTLWWNTPNIFNVSVPQRRLKVKDADKKFSKENNVQNRVTKALRYYESLITTDLLHTSLEYSSTMEPILNNWSVEVKNSLELGERMDGNSPFDFVGEVTHLLVDGCVEDFKKSVDVCGINMALPNSSERRWRAKQHLCEDFLKEPIPLSCSLERRSVSLDYLPNLRNIARSEKIRSTVNTKRGNRFRHYFRNLNMDYDENMCKVVSNILVLEEF